MLNVESYSNQISKEKNVLYNKIIDQEDNTRSLDVFWENDIFQENLQPCRNTNENEIICTSYDPEKDDFESINGFVLNKSKQDILFITDHKFHIGSPVHIRSKISEAEITNNGHEDWGHAYVIRCEELEESNHHSLYRIKSEYF
jgi:hypothetical protein